MLQPVAPDIYRLRIPIPVPLRSVNAYILQGPQGSTIIDTGFHTPEAEALWREALKGIGPVEQIVVTHYHPDHYGMAGWLQEVTAAPVYMLAGEAQAAQLVWGTAGTAAAISAFFETHGLPPSTAEAIRQNQLAAQALVLPQPAKIYHWHPGEEVILGGQRYVALATQGHTDHQLCLFGLDNRLFFSADQVLPKITPNISIWQANHQNPLAQFFASLDRLAKLQPARVLPGHGNPFGDLAGRIAEIKAHHEERLAEVRRLAQGQSAWAVAQSLFAGRLDDVNQQRFGLAEALSHLEYLVAAGQLTRQGGRPITYGPLAS